RARRDRALVALARTTAAGVFRRCGREARRPADVSRARIRRSAGRGLALLARRQLGGDRFELVEPGRRARLAHLDDFALRPVAVGVGERIDGRAALDVDVAERRLGTAGVGGRGLAERAVAERGLAEFGSA